MNTNISEFERTKPRKTLSLINKLIILIEKEIEEKEKMLENARQLKESFLKGE